VLLKVAAALHVRWKSCSRPAWDRPPVQGRRADRAPPRQGHDPQAAPEVLRGLDIERLELPIGASMAGVPHTPAPASI